MNNLNVGIAGELRVMSELLLRGKNPAKSYLDMGIDCILENGKTIQIKTSSASNKHKREKKKNVYTFTFQDWKNRTHRIIAHYIICWCVEDNIFIIFPSSFIDGKGCIRFVKSETNQFAQFINNWEILN